MALGELTLVIVNSFELINAFPGIKGCIFSALFEQSLQMCVGLLQVFKQQPQIISLSALLFSLLKKLLCRRQFLFQEL